MRVFLGNAPWRAPGRYGVRAGSRWPHLEDASSEYMPFPFFLAYAAAVLERQEHEVLLIDGIAEGLDDATFDQRLLAFAPQLVLLEVSTPSIEQDQWHWTRLRRLLGQEVWLALAGIHQPMHRPEWLLDHPEVDFVLVGEYELLLARLVEQLARRAPLEGLTGLIFRKDGQPQGPAGQALIAELDQLPWPARHQLPLLAYRDEPGNIPRPSVQMWASRGCPYRCSFCAWPQIMYGGFKYRPRNVIDVVDETEWLVRELSFRSVYYDDDTFNIGRPRMLQFCHELERRQLNIPWAIMARLDGMDSELLATMARAGLRAVKYGIESATQEIVDRCQKRLDLGQVQEVVQATHAQGIKTHLTFMLGLPGETRETARRTIELALSLMPESVQFSLATPFPGSQLYEQLQREGKLSTTDYSRFVGFHTAVVATDELDPAELEELLDEANRRWQQRTVRRLFASDPGMSVPQHDSAARISAGADTGERGGGEPTATRSRKELVTVIVPNHNGCPVLPQCLEALQKQTYYPRQVLVVDDASTDHSVQQVKELMPEAELICLPQQRGFAATVNTGLRAAQGKLIALLNSDTHAEPRWLAASIEALHRHLDVGMVTGKILTFDHPPRIYSVGIGITRSGYLFNIGQGTRERGQYNLGGYVPGVSGAASVWRKEVFDMVGDFDEDLAHYLEDVDLSLRAQLEGIRCYYEPAAVVRHRGGAASGGLQAPLVIRQLARNSIGVLIKTVPRSLIKRHLFRLGSSHLTRLLHYAAQGQSTASLQGTIAGVKMIPQMIRKRKKILGAMKVKDEGILELMLQSEQYLQEMLPHLSRRAAMRARVLGFV